MQEFLILSFFIGVFSAFIGTFYRNILKGRGMILNPLYYLILRNWAYGDNRFLSFISRPLGFCCYCYTFWITLLIYAMMVSLYYPVKWQYLIFGFIIAEGVQHIVLAIVMKFLIKGMKDFDPDTWEDNSRPTIKGFTNDSDDNPFESEKTETNETTNIKH